MRRVLLFGLLLTFGLTACIGGGVPDDTSIADPPESTEIADVSEIENSEIRAIIEGWQAEVPGTMIGREVLEDTIEQKVYLSEESLEDIAAFYEAELAEGDPRWRRVEGMPGLQEDLDLLLAGYDIGGGIGGGIVSVTIGAIDAEQFGGSGVVIYTAKGSKEALDEPEG
ncbi:MAG: hypothetical protein GFH27_549305n177 [Chloroflexi bacterium AL-W]|nr:hypothetical protein [Chloroflexi bacterium AL-N1]NOK71195.1 hypothetical protein [Chloroflexi bacterium AL-N10]NOK76484.1 hypothetical protein [Chloroflexi bacterium AL-N5]NOK83601.1 hypothetical protein [Chloroflexi bacterium AL-W]NOK92277.1 hypothetical protein [Chloroflexi bacterium AL-N15]